MFEYHLDEDIFEVVKNGTKNVAARLYDEKRRLLNVGDKLVFIKRPLMEEKIVTKIVGLKVFKNFKEMVSEYDINRLYLSNYEKQDFLKLLERFYSVDNQEKYGVVAIEFEKVN